VIKITERFVAFCVSTATAGSRTFFPESAHHRTENPKGMLALENKKKGKLYAPPSLLSIGPSGVGAA
jgi:hypothetical protein